MQYLYTTISTPNNFYSALNASEKVAFFEGEINREYHAGHHRKTAEVMAKVQSNPMDFVGPRLVQMLQISRSQQ